jgi:ureidoacrylate peracid hydrolase
MTERNQAAAAAGSRAPASTAGARSVAHPDGSPSLDRVGADDTWSFEPTTTAVVVVDVQRLFTDMVGAPIEPPLNEVLPRIGRFVDDSRKAGTTIVLVRTIIAPDAHSRSTRQWPEFMRAGMAPDAPGSTFDPCLNPQPGDFEVVKQRYSAFVGTRLDEILRERGIVSIIVLGFTTNVCVQSTARDAWQRDYETITLADCCAEIGPGSHDASLAWTARNFGTVCKTEEVMRRWRDRPANQGSTE